MIRVACLNLFSLAFLLLLSSAHSQTQEQGTPDDTVRLSTDLVVLDVQVLNKKTGRNVPDLRREDFSIYEDGVRQEIKHFSQDKVPLSVVLLLDTSSSVWSFMKQIRERTIRALQQLRPEDEVALIATASKTQLIQDFTKDRQLIAEKIQGIDETALGSGGILLHDALYEAATHLNKASNPATRRVVIVVTDNVSTQLPGKGHSENEALHEIFESGGVVCGLNVESLGTKVLKYDPTFYVVRKLFLRGDINAYAHKTGGLVLKSSKEDLDAKLSEMINHLRARYTLGYVSSNTKQDGKFRKIRMRVSPDVEKRVGELMISTKRGYYSRRNNAAACDLTAPNAGRIDRRVEAG